MSNHTIGNSSIFTVWQLCTQSGDWKWMHAYGKLSGRGLEEQFSWTASASLNSSYEAPAEKGQQAIGQNYYSDRQDPALGQNFSAPAEIKSCEWEDCNCFKNRLSFKNTVPQVSGSMERRAKTFLRYTHQLTVCSPMDISLWRARQWKDCKRLFAWLVLGKKGQIYKTQTCIGCLKRKHVSTICCTPISESCTCWAVALESHFLWKIIFFWMFQVVHPPPSKRVYRD